MWFKDMPIFNHFAVCILQFYLIFWSAILQFSSKQDGHVIALVENMNNFRLIYCQYGEGHKLRVAK